MDDTQSVYYNPERKRELVELLKENHQTRLEFANILEKKIWDIFGITSGTVGIVTAIDMSIISDTPSGWFWAGLAGVFVLYALQVWMVWLAVRPQAWMLVPNANDGDTRYETLINKYIAEGGQSMSDDEYLNQLIADYAGCIDQDDPSGHKIALGAIQMNEALNSAKATYINYAALLMGGIIATLVLLSFAATL